MFKEMKNNSVQNLIDRYMNTSIIDPSTLTEEQRKAIKNEYNLNVVGEERSSSSSEELWYGGRNLTLLWLFGENFFKKGE